MLFQILVFWQEKLVGFHFWRLPIKENGDEKFILATALGKMIYGKSGNYAILNENWGYETKQPELMQQTTTGHEKSNNS